MIWGDRMKFLMPDVYGQKNNQLRLTQHINMGREIFLVKTWGAI